MNKFKIIITLLIIGTLGMVNFVSGCGSTTSTVAPSVLTGTASATTGNIAGLVSAEGIALSGVTVVITGTSNTITTDASGVYIFTGIEEGSKTLQATKNNYSTAAVTVEVRSGQTVTAETMTLTASAESTVSSWETILWGSSVEERGSAVGVDSSGNIYVTGSTKGDLDGGANAGYADFFLVKYNSAGVRQWVKQIGTAGQDQGTALALDSSDNIYVIGTCGTNFDSNPTLGFDDVFILKYSAAGTKIWSKVIGTSQQDSGSGIALDAAGNVYLTGSTTGSFEGMANLGENDIFVAKYNSAGEKQWLDQFGTNVNDESRALTIDSSGNIYLTGYTADRLDGNPMPIGQDIFVAKYSTAGKRQWTKTLGSTGNEVGMAIALDSQGRILVAGHTSGDLAGSINQGQSDIFLVKFSPAGDLDWIQLLGSLTHDYASSLAVDASDNIYITGTTQGTLEGNTFAGQNDIFISKYSTGGERQWIKQSGTIVMDEGIGIALAENGNLFVTGFSQGNLDNQINTGGGEGGDMFILGYDSSGNKL